MTCPQCEFMAARNRRQYEMRQARMRAAPDIEPYRCVGCDTTDWATTEAFIRPEPEPAPSGWSRPFAYLKHLAGRRP